MSTKPVFPVSGRARGFTLVELLVVIAIIGVLVRSCCLRCRQREAARRMSCTNNLKQIGIADLNYENSNGNLVPARLGPDSSGSLEVRHLRTAVERSGASGLVLLLPFMEQGALYDQLDVYDNQSIFAASDYVRGEWRTDARNEAIATRPQVYVCPVELHRAGQQRPVSHVVSLAGDGDLRLRAGHRGVNGGFAVNACMTKHHNTGLHLYWTTRKMREIEDGTSNTISVGEIVDGHTRESSNIWSYVLPMRTITA